MVPFNSDEQFRAIMAYLFFFFFFFCLFVFLFFLMLFIVYFLFFFILRSLYFVCTCCLAVNNVSNILPAAKTSKCDYFTNMFGNNWLVGWSGFNGPLRQYFSPYRAVSQREGERGERIVRVKMSKPPLPAPTASAIGPCPTVIKIVGRPGTGSLPSTIANVSWCVTGVI